jgi:hypothetical protein
MNTDLISDDHDYDDFLDLDFTWMVMMRVLWLVLTEAS